MKQVNFNTYQVYYLNNDRQKCILKTGLCYFAAVKFWQQCNTNGVNNCEYECI